MGTKFLTRDEFLRGVEAGQSLPAEVLLRKQDVGEIERQLEPVPGVAPTRQRRFCISTGSVDRDNDTISPVGWHLDNYRKNPVVLWAHDYRGLPVAKAVDLRVENGRLMATADFADHPMAEAVLRLVDQGVLNATSVGFRPLKYGINEERRGLDFVEQELLEFSIVPVPANPEALIEQRALDGEGAALVAWAKGVLAQFDYEPDAGKPYPNEHACRLQDPAKFDQFRRGTRDHEGKTYSIIFGHLKDGDTWQEQAYRYPKDGWTVPQARKHCKAHDGIAFEPAGEAALVPSLAKALAVELRASLGTVAPVQGTLLQAPDPAELAEAVAEQVKEILLPLLLAHAAPPAAEEERADTKAGRVLSRANENKLAQAATLIDDVLAQVREQPEEDAGAAGAAKAGSCCVEKCTSNATGTCTAEGCGHKTCGDHLTAGKCPHHKAAAEETAEAVEQPAAADVADAAVDLVDPETVLDLAVEEEGLRLQLGADPDTVVIELAEIEAEESGLDIGPDELRQAMRSAMADLLAGVVREQVDTTLRRLRGRVD